MEQPQANPRYKRIPAYVPVGEMRAKEEWIKASQFDGEPVFSQVGYEEVKSALETIDKKKYNPMIGKQHQENPDGSYNEEIQMLFLIVILNNATAVFNVYATRIEGKPRLVFYKNMLPRERELSAEDRVFLKDLSNAIKAKMPTPNGLTNINYRVENTRGRNGKRTYFDLLPEDLLENLLKTAGKKRNPLVNRLTGGKKRKTHKKTRRTKNKIEMPRSNKQQPQLQEC